MDSSHPLAVHLKKVASQFARFVHNRRLQARLQAGSALALGVGLFLSAMLISGVFKSFEARFSDFLYQPLVQSGQVVLVAVDDASVKEIGPLPWSRNIYANLIKNIAQAEPRSIALETMFSDPAGSDQALAQALESTPNIIQPVIGVNASRNIATSGPIPRYELALLPTIALRTANTTFAHTMIFPDTDGVVRRLPVFIEADGQRYLAMGLVAAGALGVNGLVTASGGDANYLSDLMRADARGQVLVRFSAPDRRNVVSSADVLNHRVDTSRLSEKVVLIGVTASTDPNEYDIPWAFGSQPVHSVEIQADLAEMLLDGISPVGQERLTELTMIFLVALLAGATLPHVRLLTAVGLTIVYFLAYLGYAFAMYSTGILVQPLYPAIALFMTLACTMIYRYFAEDRERGITERLFQRHTAPETLGRLLEQYDRGEVTLRGTRREVSILYIDMREFSLQIQSLTSEAAVRLLSEYLSTIISTIFRHGGLVIRQMGSACVAAWNIPVDQPDHATSAIRCAIDVRDEILQLNAKQQKELAVGVGIGVSTGHILAGRVGNSSLAEYTLIGEPIVIAQHLAMRRDGMVFLDAPTRAQIDLEEFDTIAVNRLRLRRKTDPLDIWEITPPMELEQIPEPIETEQME